ncbi:hypothetical protein PB1_03550 [Bacillus methanolicus PB1]|uniref:Uncharacterized protein n=1 Tax=Bacillus methanolicus PB1 TaxID=997296 RepID=I3E660_BACMT|nr:hypothetical protein PB1_03550 [Bacillus methanolicus PB1]
MKRLEIPTTINLLITLSILAEIFYQKILAFSGNFRLTREFQQQANTMFTKSIQNQ